MTLGNDLMEEQSTGFGALMKKDDIRTAVAVVVCILVVMVYSQVVMEPYRREMELRRLKAVKEAQQTSAASKLAAPSIAQPGTPGTGMQAQATTAQAPVAQQHPTPAEINSKPSTLVESERILARITHLGARLTSYKLKQHHISLGSESPLDMVASAEGEPLPLALHTGGVNDDRVEYALAGVTENTQQDANHFTITNASSAKDLNLRFTGTLPNGIGVIKTFRFLPNSYLFEVNVELAEPSRDGSKLWLEWSHHQSANLEMERLNPLHFALLGENNKVVMVPAASAPAGLPEYGGNRWVSLGDKYFLAAIVPTETGINTRLGKEKDLYLMRTAGNAREGRFTVFAGPKDYRELQAIGYQLDRNVDLGWFSFLAHPLLWLIKAFYRIFHNYGLAIILLTLIIKALFLPLTKSSLESMKAMQALQPEIKALRERIDDPNKLNQEMMALYKKRGVNPMGGCLPMLIQLPVFLGLYNALLNSIELRHAPFALWITDLSAPESLQIWGIGVPVMILLMGASMIIQQATTPTVGDPAQKRMMMMMPVIFTIMFILFPFPSGLVLYWLVNNVISILQQAYLRGEGKGNPLHATILGSLAIFGFGFVLTLI